MILDQRERESGKRGNQQCPVLLYFLALFHLFTISPLFSSAYFISYDILNNHGISMITDTTLWSLWFTSVSSLNYCLPFTPLYLYSFFCCSSLFSSFHCPLYPSLLSSHIIALSILSFTLSLSIYCLLFFSDVTILSLDVSISLYFLSLYVFNLGLNISFFSIISPLTFSLSVCF